MIDNINKYLSALIIAKDLYQKGILSSKDLVKCEAYLMKKYCIKPNSVYRINDLINEATRVIYSGKKRSDTNDESS